MRKVIVNHTINPNDYKEGDSFSKQYKVVGIDKNYLVIARMFKNGNPKKMSKKFVFTS